MQKTPKLAWPVIVDPNRERGDSALAEQRPTLSRGRVLPWSRRASASGSVEIRRRNDAVALANMLARTER